MMIGGNGVRRRLGPRHSFLEVDIFRLFSVNLFRSSAIEIPRLSFLHFRSTVSTRQPLCLSGSFFFHRGSACHLSHLLLQHFLSDDFELMIGLGLSGTVFTRRWPCLWWHLWWHLFLRRLHIRHRFFGRRSSPLLLHHLFLNDLELVSFPGFFRGSGALALWDKTRSF